MHSARFKNQPIAAVMICLLGGLPGLRAASPQPPREISPILVGTNLWHKIPDSKVWRLTDEASVRLIRIGGHSYDRKVPSDETLVQWVKRIRSVGAEPLIQVSQYEPAEKAAEIVRLFNVKRAAGQPVRYWNIGNEPWLQGGKGDVKAASSKIAAYFKTIAAEMKKTDPDIKIYGPDACSFIDEIYQPLFGGKHDITGKVPGKNYYYCDGLSWHRYPQTANEPGLAEVEDFLQNIKKARELADLVNAKHRRKGEDALQWGIGEFNARGGGQVHTFGNGQMFGAVYANCALYGAAYAANWSMYENNGNRQGTDFSIFDGEDFTPRASYWHMRLFAEHFKGTTLPSRSNRSEVLVFSSYDKAAGAVGVMILNMSSEPGPLPYELHFGKGRKSGRGLVLNVPLGDGKIRSDVIAPRSSQFLLFERGSLRKTTYSKEDFDAGRQPNQVTLPKPFEE